MRRVRVRVRVRVSRVRMSAKFSEVSIMLRVDSVVKSYSCVLRVSSLCCSSTFVVEVH